MLHIIRNQSLLWFVPYLTLFLIVCLLAGCTVDTGNSQREKKKGTPKENKQTLTYTSVTIPVDTASNTTLVYDPVDNVLSQIQRTGRIYSRSSWQTEKGWSTGVEKWKIKKNYVLDNFSYNTNGVLYACQKKRKKGKLTSQYLVRLRSNGKIQKIQLTDLNRLSASPVSDKHIPEITDIQCCGTSIAITYQYGSVKIYNLAEGQALGASTITGTPEKNIFYDLHYLSIGTKKGTQDILLRDYDIRSGEVTRSFPLGGAGQNTADYYMTNYQNHLYLLTNRGLFAGQCSESTLTLLLHYSDLKLPEHSRIVYLQASRDESLYLGYKTSEGTVQLRLITTPDHDRSESKDTRENSQRISAHV